MSEEYNDPITHALLYVASVFEAYTGQEVLQVGITDQDEIMVTTAVSTYKVDVTMVNILGETSRGN